MSKSKVEIVLNSAGIRKYLKSASVKDMLKQVSGEIADRAGEGYENDIYETKGRYITSVFTQSDEAIQDNSENNTILRSL